LIIERGVAMIEIKTQLERLFYEKIRACLAYIEKKNNRSNEHKKSGEPNGEITFFDIFRFSIERNRKPAFSREKKLYFQLENLFYLVFYFPQINTTSPKPYKTILIVFLINKSFQ
jgi:hypothetical protein